MHQPIASAFTVAEVMNAVLMEQAELELGLVSPGPGDWSLESTTWPMAIMIASGGVSAALLASWTVRVGVR